MNPTPAEAVSVRDENALNDAAWKFIDNATGDIPAPLWNNLKAALWPAIQCYISATESAATQPAGEIGEIITYGTGFQEVRWVAGDMPPSGTKLYTVTPAATSVTSVPPKEVTAESLWVDVSGNGDFVLDQSAPIEAGELPELPQLPLCDASYSGGRFYGTDTMQEYARAYGQLCRDTATKPASTTPTVDAVSAMTDAEIVVIMDSAQAEWGTGNVDGGLRLHVIKSVLKRITPPAPVPAGEFPPLPKADGLTLTMPDKHSVCELLWHGAADSTKKTSVYTERTMRAYVLVDRASRGKASDAEALAMVAGVLGQQTLKDAARWNHIRNLPEELTGTPGQPCLAMPNGMSSGYYLTEENADFAVDASMAEHAERAIQGGDHG